MRPTDCQGCGPPRRTQLRAAHQKPDGLYQQASTSPRARTMPIDLRSEGGALSRWQEDNPGSRRRARPRPGITHGPHRRQGPDRAGGGGSAKATIGPVVLRQGAVAATERTRADRTRARTLTRRALRREGQEKALELKRSDAGG